MCAFKCVCVCVFVWVLVAYYCVRMCKWYIVCVCFNWILGVNVSDFATVLSGKILYLLLHV